MANVKFYLRTKTKGITSINARFYFKYFEIDKNEKKEYKFMQVSTGETIHPKYWNNKTGRVSERYTGHSEFNQRLNDISFIIIDTYRKFLNDQRGNDLTPDNLKKEVYNRLFNENKTVKPKNKETCFIDFIKLIIIESKAGQRINNKTSQLIKNGTIKSYQSTLNNLIKYETEKNINLKFSDINLKFYNDYVQYLNKKNYAINTIGGRIKNIKVFMKIAYNKGLTDNLDFQKTEFRKVSEDTEAIYLTEVELMQIYSLDLTNSSRLNNVRDLFLIGCYTGLRFSDLQQLRKEHFKNNVVEITTLKTGQKVIIPQHWIISEILKKYDYNLPRMISNQKMNEYLKELGKLAQIDSIINITQNSGGLQYDKQYKKYELITVHTARRSFATNMYLNDIPTISIMQITGHTSEKIFLRYIKVTKEENANKLAQHPFFIKPSYLKVV